MVFAVLPRQNTYDETTATYIPGLAKPTSAADIAKTNRPIPPPLTFIKDTFLCMD